MRPCYIKNIDTGYYIGGGKVVRNGYEIILSDTFVPNDPNYLDFLWVIEEPNDGIISIQNMNTGTTLTIESPADFSTNGENYYKLWTASHVSSSNIFNAFITTINGISTIKNKNSNIASDGLLCIDSKNINAAHKSFYCATGNNIKNINWSLIELK